MDEVLMLHGVVAWCGDCDDERFLLPVDHDLCFCCTECDAAVWLGLSARWELRRAG